PILWLVLSGLSAAASFVCWYKANSMVGCAIGMSLNVTYAFWGVLFCVLFLGQTLTPTIVIGSIVIVLGAIIVTMNPLDLFRKGDA
ncbi:EamA family transporter, partial [Enterococcus sp. S181_ASV_20]|nr:EamA family transporter [Enterococcus sp. S181_ASV_20]